MRLQSASLVLLTGLAGLTAAAALSNPQAPGGEKKPQTGKKPAASRSSLSGCVDQKEGHYILVDDRNLSPVADLEADGFPTEGFAKHVGHKVTITGTTGPGSTRPVFKVRSIATLSETCAPTPQSEKEQK